MNEEELQKKAKEQSQVLLKTFFRFAACAYLIWLGGHEMALKYFQDPENSSKGYLIFGIIFCIAGLVYLVHAIRVYTAATRKRNEEMEELEKAAQAAQAAKAVQSVQAVQAAETEAAETEAAETETAETEAAETAEKDE